MSKKGQLDRKDQITLTSSFLISVTKNIFAVKKQNSTPYLTWIGVVYIGSYKQPMFQKVLISLDSHIILSFQNVVSIPQKSPI